MPWTTHETTLLQQQWPRVDPRLIARRLQRSQTAVLEKAKSLGLGPSPLRRSHWNDESVETLRKLWGHRDLPAIARHLNRSTTSVSQMAKKIGLGPPWHAVGYTPHEVGQLTGAKTTRIRAALAALGIVLFAHRSRTDMRFKRKTRLLIRHQDLPVLTTYLAETPRIFADRTGAGLSTKGKWGVGKKASCCAACGTTARPHYAKDRCQRCYDRRRNRHAQA